MLARAKALEQDFFLSHTGSERRTIDVEEQWDEETRAELTRTLSPGLFATPYVILIRGVETLDEKNGSMLESILKTRDNSMLVVLIYSLGGKKKLPKWWVSLGKDKEVKEEAFTQILGMECQQYIDSVLKNFGIESTIEPRAKAFLAESLAHDTGRLTQELQRLTLLATGQPITLKLVEEGVSQAQEAVTFQALDALVRGDRTRAIALFRREETEPDAPFALLGLCAWQVRRLIAIKELFEEGKDAGMIARELKTSLYPIQKTLPMVTRFSFSRLRRALTLLTDFDLALKTGRIQPGVALDLFIWKF